MRRWVEAFNARDIEALIALCDPDIEFHSAFAAVGGAIYHGHDGLRKWHRDLQDVWGPAIHTEPEAFFDLSGRMLTFYIYRARGQHSGAEVARPAAAVSTWRDGLMTYLKVYLDKAEALNDLGMSEDELEPIAP
jgi:ketosteroid isomerase-like protein